MPKRGGVQAIYATIANLGSTANKFHDATQMMFQPRPLKTHEYVKRSGLQLKKNIRGFRDLSLTQLELAILVHALVTSSAIFIPLKADCEIIEMRLHRRGIAMDTKWSTRGTSCNQIERQTLAAFNRRSHSGNIQSSSAELKLKISLNWLDRQVDLLSWLSVGGDIWKLSAVWSEGSLRFKWVRCLRSVVKLFDYSTSIFLHC